MSRGNSRLGNNCRLPPELYYDPPNHVWVRPEAGEGERTAAGVYTLGITDVGQTLAGELLHCQPKAVGTALIRGKAAALIESGKSIWPVRCPIAGCVVQVNTDTAAAPATINADPYGAGWIVRIQATDSEPGLAEALAQLATGDAMLADYRLLMEDIGFGECIPGDADSGGADSGGTKATPQLQSQLQSRGK